MTFFPRTDCRSFNSSRFFHNFWKIQSRAVRSRRCGMFRMKVIPLEFVHFHIAFRAVIKSLDREFTAAESEDFRSRFSVSNHINCEAQSKRLRKLCRSIRSVFQLRSPLFSRLYLLKPLINSCVNLRLHRSQRV